MEVVLVPDLLRKAKYAGLLISDGLGRTEADGKLYRDLVAAFRSKVQAFCVVSG